MKLVTIRVPKIAVLLALAFMKTEAADVVITSYGAVADDAIFDTRAIQDAIDACATSGGGTVRVPRGTYLSGALTLENKVFLHLDSASMIQGSDRWQDYGDGNWNNALITLNKMTSGGIKGTGTLDGVDCNNPNGEEGFRGPHAVHMTECQNITFEDFTIRRSANWAFCTWTNWRISFSNITILGGHDGIDAQDCSTYTVTNCDFQTGDDCFAGCENRNFTITDCKLNTSCNGFRFQCDGMTVRRCKFYGPGRYWHKISQRKNMISAFVHFAPKERNPTLPSDNWLIEDCTVDSVDYFYYYEFGAMWQDGQGVKTIRMRNITGTNLLRDSPIIADNSRQFNLILENVDMSFRPDSWNDRQMSFDISNFHSVKIYNSTFRNRSAAPVLVCTNGDSVVLQCVQYVPSTNTAPFSLNNIGKSTIIPCPVRRTAYNGPHKIPGRTQAEDYDNGGEGVAYHDADTTNNGGQYRQDGVDIEVAADPLGGGHSVGWGNAGEWLEYTIDSVKADTYDINVRCGTGVDGAQVRVKLDGVSLGTVNVPNLGNWTDMRTLTITGVTLVAGTKRILRVEIVGTGEANINWVEFTKASGTAAGAAAHSVVGRRTEMVEIMSLDGRVVARMPSVEGQAIGQSMQYQGRGIYLVRNAGKTGAIGRIVSVGR